MSTHFLMWSFQLAYKVRTKIFVTTPTFCLVACYSYWFSPSSWKCPRSLIRHSISPRMPRISLHSSSWTTPLSCSHLVVHTSPGPLSSLLFTLWHSRFLSTLSPGMLLSPTSHTAGCWLCSQRVQKNKTENLGENLNFLYLSQKFFLVLFALVPEPHCCQILLCYTNRSYKSFNWGSSIIIQFLFLEP